MKLLPNAMKEKKAGNSPSFLAGEQLGDRKPSELFRVMQQQPESHNVTDSLLLELFLQHLTSNVQSILASIQPLTVQKASEVADRILEVTPVQHSNALQRFIDEVTRGLKGVYAFIDDILIASQNVQEHTTNIRALFERLDYYG
ncbi:retrovirus-related Pol polyprotein from transposon 17.6 [Trichonephila clavipes]|nr:retrovirus-related Pol polyprotein from transposon 17.6 [Trichonephila clavipes]